MPLTLRYTAAELADNTGFDITDATGSYGASNTGGFGAPNPDIADILTCIASITKPDPITFQPSTDPAMTIDIDVYYGTTDGELPNTTGVKQTILATDLGYTETLQNGVYAIQITATDIDTTYTSAVYYLLVYGSLVCCLTRPYLTLNLDECGDCLKKDSAVWNILMGNLALNGAYWSWYYASADGIGDFSKTGEYLAIATDLCEGCTNDCGCGGS